MLINGSPQVMILAIDLNEHLIQVSLVTGSRTPSTQVIREGLAELEAPFTNRFVAERDATHPHDLFDIAKAQSEAEVKPHSVANDFGRKTMAAIKRRGGMHQPIMQHVQSCSMPASIS